MDVTLIPEETSSTIDLLNRQEFVDRILQVAGALSQNKKNACYAVDGAWGSGKSFVMDMFEKQAKDIGQEGTTLSRYLVFHYNCWEYDYYEEPLIAIVITMLDAIDKSVNLLDSKTKTQIKEILKNIAKGFGKKVIETIEEKTGVNIQETVETVSKGLQGAKKEVKNDFDPYDDFKKSLKNLQKAVASLSANQTVIFVVDELDRCLPEYAIKVLERLHHLFTGIPDVQVILSIDKKQLEHTVRQIYGPKTDVDRYLAKFINFSLHLGIGSLDDTEKLQVKFQEYFKLFTCKYKETKPTDVMKFCQELFDEIDVRTRISLIEKSMLIHELLSAPNEKYDFSIMCIEMFLIVIQYYKVDVSIFRESMDGDGVLFVVHEPANTQKRVLQQITKRYQSRKLYQRRMVDNEEICYIDNRSIWGVILAAYFVVLKGKLFFFSGTTPYGPVSYDEQTIISSTNAIWDTLKILS